MFLTPDDHLPFFAGTYFPIKPRFGLPGFKDLLLHITDVYQNRETDIRSQNISFAEAFNKMDVMSHETDSSLSERALQVAYTELQQSFDPNYGGFGSPPKFPHPGNIERLFHHALAAKSTDEKDKTLQMALFTLEKMAVGGIYDHIGGGFSRYSVDQYWMIPHFEKMLYDNGPLLVLYFDAWQISKQDLFKQVTLETADWVMREMQSPQGGYYSSIDADSEGEEGKFYVWDRKEVKAIVGEEHYKFFAYQYGLEQPANFEGQWHFYLHHTIEETAEKFALDLNECKEKINQSRTMLFSHREQRIRPELDDKILGSWNALMIKGMVTAGRVFERTDCIDSACKSLDFIMDNLWENNRLYATYKDGKAHLNAYLDDYAFLIDAILTVLQSRWHIKYLNFAIQLAETLLDQFMDEEQGSFFFTSHDHEKLIHREKPYMDDALPSGNGIACLALFHLETSHR